jgi:hypothetical protein
MIYHNVAIGYKYTIIFLSIIYIYPYILRKIILYIPHKPIDPSISLGKLGANAILGVSMAAAKAAAQARGQATVMETWWISADLSVRKWGFQLI